MQEHQSTTITLRQNFCILSAHPFFFQSRAGSYFYYPRLTKRHPAAAASATGASKHSQHLPPKNSSSFRSSFDGSPISSAALTARPPSAQSEEMKRAITLRRVSSLKNTSDDIEVSKGVFDQFAWPIPDDKVNVFSTDNRYAGSRSEGWVGLSRPFWVEWPRLLKVKWPQQIFTIS